MRSVYDLAAARRYPARNEATLWNLYLAASSEFDSTDTNAIVSLAIGLKRTKGVDTAQMEQRLSIELTAFQRLEKNKVPDTQRSHEALERRYRNYVQASLGYEDQMRNARETLRRSLPDISDRLEVLERAGVVSVEPVSPTADLTGIGRAVEAAHRSLPHETIKAIERNLRRERNRDRSRGMDFDR